MTTEPVVRLSELLCRFAADAFNQLPAERPKAIISPAIECRQPLSAPYDCEVV